MKRITTDPAVLENRRQHHGGKDGVYDRDDRDDGALSFVSDGSSTAVRNHRRGVSNRFVVASSSLSGSVDQRPELEWSPLSLLLRQRSVMQLLRRLRWSSRLSGHGHSSVCCCWKAALPPCDGRFLGSGVSTGRVGIQ
jgi:hypothetical protein